MCYGSWLSVILGLFGEPRVASLTAASDFYSNPHSQTDAVVLQRLLFERIVVTHSDRSVKISYNGCGNIRPRESSGSRLRVLSVNIMTVSCVLSKASLLCSFAVYLSQPTKTHTHTHTEWRVSKVFIILFEFN